MDIISFLIGKNAYAVIFVAYILAMLLFLIFSQLKNNYNKNNKISSDLSYSEKLSELTDSLIESSKEIDGIFIEINEVSIERGEKIKILNQQLDELSIKEYELKDKIEKLENVPLKAIDHLSKILDRGDKRSAWRDYALFTAGVILSTIISLIIGG